MSGVAGGNRIQKKDVQRTFDSFIKEVLEKIPGYKKAVLSGSIKVGAKADYGDIDAVVWFEGEDKKEVKQRIIDTVTSLPSSLIIPFKSEKYKGKRYYNSGEIITVLFPIRGSKQDETIQVDMVIALTEEEHVFKGSFLDIPAEKQGLLLGLAKVILLEEDSASVFKRMGIENLPPLEKDEEFEFNLSSVKLTLRKVKLQDFKEVAREDIWSSTAWSAVETLLENYKIDGSFEELLEDISAKLKNPRSRKRIAGIFKSMVSVKSGEIGTLKGDNKIRAIDLVDQLLSEAQDVVLDDTPGEDVVAIFSGGFKPPHRAHFENARQLSQGADKLIIFIGKKIREGLKITAEQSDRIWQIYAKYLPIKTEIRISPITPIRDFYDYIDINQASKSKIISGAMRGSNEFDQKFGTILKHPEKYPKVVLKFLDTIETEEEDKLSASTLRASLDYLKEGKWIPAELSGEDRIKVLNIAMENANSIEERMMESLEETIDQFFPMKKNESSSGTPIAPKSIMKSQDRVRLQDLFSELREKLKDTGYYVTYNYDHIRISTNPPGTEMGFNYTPYMASLLEHMMDQGMKITPLPEIKVNRQLTEEDSIFRSTGHYDPTKKEIVLYASSRHPKDILRSFAHEMMHHFQNLQGRLKNINSTDTTVDKSLLALEEEAYAKGNMLFRTWEDTQKKKQKSE